MHHQILYFHRRSGIYRPSRVQLTTRRTVQHRGGGRGFRRGAPQVPPQVAIYLNLHLHKYRHKYRHHDPSRAAAPVDKSQAEHPQTAATSGADRSHPVTARRIILGRPAHLNRRLQSASDDASSPTVAASGANGSPAMMTSLDTRAHANVPRHIVSKHIVTGSATTDDVQRHIVAANQRLYQPPP